MSVIAPLEIESRDDMALRGEMSQLRRVLLISYHFPPVGGAGVQRPIKFCKYLRQFGWEPTVLTAENPSAPVFDESLCRDLPEGLQIERARTWEPDYKVKQNLNATAANNGGWNPKRWLSRWIKSASKLVLQPDPQILWLPNAYRKGVQLLSGQKFDAILATAPTYTNFIVGGMLKRKFGVPLLLDYRDEWDLSSKYLENRSRDWYSSWIQERQQQYVLRSADALIATTEQSAETLQERAAKLGRKLPSECIYNGYDEEDFAGLKRQGDKHDRFRLVYTGTLWNLTSVEPIVQAVERLHHQQPDLCELLEFETVGRNLPEQSDLLTRLQGTGCRLTVETYQPHSEVVQRMVRADAQCLLLSDVPGAERVVPGKMFEYLAAGRPILAVMPSGDSSQIVEKFFPDNHFVPRDVAGIAEWLENSLRNFQEGRPLAEGVNQDEIRQFSRVGQTERLADLLNTVTRTDAKSGVVR
ncbi:MAG: glycosyltransferase family 4 protein [Planctomycetaceae bacterium]|nr:glycosyltransferase family 4 protein [Planctomycetaceae bacterium]